MDAWVEQQMTLRVSFDQRSKTRHPASRKQHQKGQPYTASHTTDASAGPPRNLGDVQNLQNVLLIERPFDHPF